jgi:biopolymer transport protein TolQ
MTVERSIEVYLAARAGGDPGLAALILEADLIVQLVLLSLLAMSVACWGIIFQKWKRLQEATRQSERFLEAFWASKRLDEVYEQLGSFQDFPVAAVFRAGYRELARLKSAADKTGEKTDATDNLTRTLRRATSSESTQLERYITFLATTGSTAPFIGLLGTVWGILRAFQRLGSGGGSTIDIVGPDIAHALVATAVGLFAAIPAVIAYNYFTAAIRVLNAEMENFSADFLNIVKRHVQ